MLDKGQKFFIKNLAQEAGVFAGYDDNHVYGIGGVFWIYLSGIIFSYNMASLLTASLLIIQHGEVVEFCVRRW